MKSFSSFVFLTNRKMSILAEILCIFIKTLKPSNLFLFPLVEKWAINLEATINIFSGLFFSADLPHHPKNKILRKMKKSTFFHGKKCISCPAEVVILLRNLLSWILEVSFKFLLYLPVSGCWLQPATSTGLLPLNSYSHSLLIPQSCHLSPDSQWADLGFWKGKRWQCELAAANPHPTLPHPTPPHPASWADHQEAAGMMPTTPLWAASSLPFPLPLSSRVCLWV